MNLTILGSSGTYPAAGRPASGYLVEQGATRILNDAGPGVFDALARTVDVDLVDAIVISHRHADHCSDLLALFHVWAYRPEPRRGVPLFAPATAVESITDFLGADQDHDFHRVFTITAVEGGEVAEVGDLEIRFAQTGHSVPNVAARYTGGHRAIVYTGDTGPGGDWPTLAEGADLLLTEATYQAGTANPGFPFHLTAAEAGAIARRQGVERLMLTHLPPELDPDRSVGEAEIAFDRPVALAVPGARHKV